MYWKAIIFCVVILLGIGWMYHVSELQEEADRPLRQACLKATWPYPKYEWGTIPLSQEATDKWAADAANCFVNAKQKEWK